MGEYIWEEVRRARQEHFCDHCFHWIGRGETYRRTAMGQRKTGKLFVLKRHQEPPCQPDDFEQEVFEEVEQGVGITFVAEVREVLKTSIDGKIVTEQEIHFVPQIVSEDPSEEGSDDLDQEIPF